MIYTNMLNRIKTSLISDLRDWKAYRYHPEYQSERKRAERNIKELLKRLQAATKFAAKHRM